MSKFIMPIGKPIGKEEIKKALISIGQEIIDRAEDVSNDLKLVRSITVFSQIEPSEAPTVRIEKEYIVTDKETPKQIKAAIGGVIKDNIALYNNEEATKHEQET